MKHILILVENLPVPRDRRVWMEATTLRDAGFKVSVISPCPDDDKENPNRIIDGIAVYRYPPPPATQSKLSFIYEFWYCLRQTQKLVSQIWKKDRFDAIQTCNPPDTFWWIGRKYKKHGVKFVFDHHDLCPELYESKYARQDLLHRGLMWMEKKQFETADAVIATNESYRQVALGRGGKKPEDVAIVRSAPRKSKFVRVPPDESLKKGFKYLGVYVGVMGVQDGVDYALRAIKSAVDKGMNDTYFIFVGQGDAKNDLIKMVSDLHLNKYVEFTGYVPDLQLQQILCTGDVALAPDPKDPLNNYCTMNKVVEYQAMGLPIVSFDLKESIISAGDAAVFVSDNNEEAFGDAIRTLLADEEKRKEMSLLGRQRFESELNWEKSEPILINFYRRLLEPGFVPATQPTAVNSQETAKAQHASI
ncbi:glycosyltransferase family 4 protein [Lacunimicrobium album]